MRYANFLLLVATLLLAGCAAFPSQVRHPTTPEEGQPYSLAEVKEYIGVSPLEFERKRLLDQTGLYAGTWNKAAAQLRLQRDIGNNGQFVMTIAGAYNVARSHLLPGKWWLAGAGGTGLILDRYQIETQALHYEQAADAMACARSAIADIPPTFWTAYDPSTGVISATLSDVPPEATNDLGIGYETLSNLWFTVNLKLGSIVNRLSKNLNSDKLKPPSADEIAKAITTKQQTESPAANAAQTMSGHIKEKFNTLAVAQTPQEAAKLILAPEKLSSLNASQQRSLVRAASLSQADFDKEKSDSKGLSLISVATWKKAILLPVTLDNCLPKAGS